MEPKTADYCLLEPVSSIEDFLKSQFAASGNKLKKYFAKKFLNRSLGERSLLTLPLNFINDGLISPSYIGSPLELIAEDEHFFVFSKNPNQFIHPLTYDEGDNCLSYLRQIRPELLEVNKAHYDRGLLYRLDYETSGVVIYAKSDELYQHLRENFAGLAKEKIYWCWVQGEMKLSGAHTHSFSSTEEKGKRVKVAQAGFGAQDGELSLIPLEFNSALNRTFVEVKLKTGLRHQIRAQMAYLGYPLVGDTFYGGPQARRLYLHARKYTLEVQGKEYFWESKPIDFNGL